MTPTQALNNLQQVARNMQLTAEQHEILAVSVQVLAGLINANGQEPSTGPYKPSCSESPDCPEPPTEQV